MSLSIIGSIREFENKSTQDRGILIGTKDPMPFINRFFKEDDINHIFFNPELKSEYEIRRGAVHDGTLIFTLELIKNVVGPIVKKRSYCTSKKYSSDFNPTKIETFKDMEYEIGMLYFYEIEGGGELPCGSNGMRERVVLPVRTIYKKKK